LETSDGGDNWSVLADSLIAPLHSIYFKDGYGWAVGDAGLVLRSDGTSWIDQSSGKVYPANYCLSPNYPNPFNPITNIRFQIPNSGFVILKIYNILGEEVATLVNDKLPAGNHEYQFDGTHLASGIYLYRLEAGPYRQVKKMILIK